MKAVSRKRPVVLFIAVTALFLANFAAHGPQTQRVADLEAKLSQRATFLPQSKRVLDQLIEVAQHYQIPMGIEWLEEPASNEGRTLTLPDDGTVLDLLKAIVQESPKHHLSVQDRIVHIAPVLALDPKNPLNLRIDSFRVTKVSLFDAEEELRLAIDMILHPKDYQEGYIQSYGYPHDSVLAVRDITFSGSNLTVQEILDGLALASGNAIWVSRLDYLHLSENTKTSKSDARPCGAEVPCPPLWYFVPLKGAY